MYNCERVGNPGKREKQTKPGVNTFLPTNTVKNVLNAGCDGHLLLGAQHCLHWLGDPPQPKSGQPSHPGQLNHHQQDAGCKQGDPDGYYPGGGVGVEPVGLLQHWLRLPHLLLLAHLRRSFLLLFDAHSDCDEKGTINLV